MKVLYDNSLGSFKIELDKRFNEVKLLEKEKKYLSLVNSDLELSKITKKENLNQLLIPIKSKSIQELLSLEYKNNLNYFLDIAIKIAKKIKILHDDNTLHANITSDGIYIDKEEVYLFNFTSSIKLSKKAAVLTPIYFKNIPLYEKSPEQLGRINNIIDFRSDLYSLGVVFYEMLFNKKPFKGKDDLDSLNLVLTKSIKNDIDLPKNIFLIIERLLEKNISKRYQSINGLIYDLELLKNDFFAHVTLFTKDIANRLQMSDKVYGRKEEIEILTKRYESVLSGELKSVFVGGYSGVGKTSLINELKTKIISTDTYCVSSKFDQYNKGKPYFAIKEAFDTLIKQILLKPKEELEELKEKFLLNLSGNGQVIIDLIPNFEKVIGKQKALDELPSNENENRFHQVFLSFLKTITSKQTPLILIVDDLQWIDFATLKLLDTFINSEDLEYLYLLCSYRDNEIDHNLQLQKMLQTNKKIEILKLESLDKKSLGEFLEDTLFLSKDELLSLINEIYLKTGANPFYFRQFIYGLYDEGLIYFDNSISKWQYNLSKIKAQNVTENVADYILKRGISSLDDISLRVLQIASTLGASFDLRMVQRIDNIDIEVLVSKIREIFNLGYLLPINTTIREMLSYDMDRSIQLKFLHDQIQQAVYTTIKKDELLKLHYDIGMRLFESKDIETNCFDIVSHLNMAKEYFNCADEKLKLIDLNKKALYLAKNSTAYEDALSYTLVALEMLDSFDFDEYYEYFIDFRLNYIELLYLTSDFKKADSEVDELFKIIKTKEDEIDLRRTLVVQYTRIGRLDVAVSEGLKALSLLGIDISSDITMEDVGSEIATIQALVEENPFSKIVELPYIKDKKILKTLDLLMEMQACAYNSGSLVFPITILRLLKLTIIHGNSYLSSYIYMMYALMNTKVLKNYQMAFEASKYAQKLQKNTKNNLLVARFNMMHSNFVMPWQNKIDEASNLREKAFNQCLACGDYYWGIHSLIFGFYSNLLTSESLDDMLVKTKSVANLSKKINQISQYYLCNIQINFIKLLNGENSISENLSEYTPLESLALKEYSEQNYMCGKYDFIVSKLMQGFMYEKYQEALDISLDKNLDESSLDEGIFHEAFYKVFNILAILSLKLEGKSEKRYDEFVKTNLSFIDIWEGFAPDIFTPIRKLIDGLEYSIANNTDKAMESYEDAIELSKDTNSLFLQAIINEEYGKYWERKNNKKIAHIYFKEAIDLYKEWKAYGKVYHLESKITSLKYAQKQTQDIDTDVIIKSSNIISKEIELEKVVKNILDLVVKLSGAQNGFIFLYEDEPKLIAQMQKSEFTYHFLNDIDELLLPSNIITYAARTKDILLINDIKSSEIAYKDTYIVAKKPKAILVVPLLINDNVKAVIYLESSKSNNIFLDKDIDIIKHLSIQITLSLENSLYYNNLESLVEERTIELKNTLSLFDLGQSMLFRWKNEKDWPVEYLSNNITQILGYEKEEFLSFKINYGELIHSEDMQRLLVELDNATKNKQTIVQHTPYRIKHKKGHYIWVYESTKMIYKDNGEVDYYIGYVVDITQEKERENYESEQSKMGALKDMLGNIAHQWRQPLTKISVSASNMQIKNELNELKSSEVEELTSFIIKTTMELSNTIDNFNKLIKKDNNYTRFNIKEVVSDAITLSMDEVKSDISIEMDIDEYLDIYSSKYYIFQIFYNILKNSIDQFIKYPKDKQNIFIDVIKDNNFVKINICDNAGGIEDEIISKVFEPYFTTSHKSEGKGLGLYTIHKIVTENLYGEISMRNKKLYGKSGACIEVVFEELKEEKKTILQ
jgi:PAS domain S-box-containing protein